MNEYAVTVFVICAICGAFSLITYGSGRAESLALGIITLFIIASPIAKTVGSLNADGWLEEIKVPEVEIGEEYNTVIMEAFADGIKSAVADKFSIDKENIRIKVSGFDVESMRAEKIKVILSGKAVFVDYRAVEKYLNGLIVGECSVEIEIG